MHGGHRNMDAGNVSGTGTGLILTHKSKNREVREASEGNAKRALEADGNS